MATTMKPPVQGTKPYTVRFSNDVGSTGVAIVVVAWVPNQGAAVPDPTQESVAPGGTGDLSDDVPAAALVRRMTVVVELDAGETGQIEVLQGSRSVFSEAVTQPMTYGMVVL